MAGCELTLGLVQVSVGREITSNVEGESLIFILERKVP